MGQVVVHEVTFAEYTAARIDDPHSAMEKVLMRLFEGKGIRMRGDQPAPPADVETDAENKIFRITQLQ